MGSTVETPWGEGLRKDDFGGVGVKISKWVSKAL
jgi:hypothetical protein